MLVCSSLDTSHLSTKFMTCSSTSASHTTKSQGYNCQGETINCQCWEKNRTSLKNKHHNLVGTCFQPHKSNGSLIFMEW